MRGRGARAGAARGPHLSCPARPGVRGAAPPTEKLQQDLVDARLVSRGSAWADSDVPELEAAPFPPASATAEEKRAPGREEEKGYSKSSSVRPHPSPPPTQEPACVAHAACARQVLRQIEYYFCEDNLRGDAFMRAKIAASPEGFIDLPLIMTFNRIR